MLGRCSRLSSRCCAEEKGLDAKRVYALPLANRLKLAVTQGLRIYRDSMA